MFGLPPATGSSLPVWAQDMPLPLGLLSADHIVAVSPTYAQEILTPEFGAGLHKFLLGRQESISGILNGIDTEQWNPQKDHFISSNFQLETLSKKQINKASLLNDFGLSQDNKKPLLAMVTRLDYQKGVDLAFDGLINLLDQNWSTIILGTGDPALEQRALELEKKFPGRFSSVVRFDNPLSHRIYAGADMLLIPSRYEPCGLTQMIAMRYGTVPIGRATGGLKDTIFDYENDTNSTGFLFQSANSDAFNDAIRRAIHTYQDQRRWKGLQRRGMSQNFSWDASALKYCALYHQLFVGHR
jgi:starch synthase